jgi:hypothetical protein
MYMSICMYMCCLDQCLELLLEHHHSLTVIVVIYVFIYEYLWIHLHVIRYVYIYMSICMYMCCLDQSLDLQKKKNHHLWPLQVICWYMPMYLSIYIYIYDSYL